LQADANQATNPPVALLSWQILLPPVEGYGSGRYPVEDPKQKYIQLRIQNKNGTT
jgi:hypothetical protein